MMELQRTDLLDRALRDLSAEQRARVLDLVIRLDIDRDDPLWLIAIAIGQLQVLVQDAPEDWQTVFQEFGQELDAWTDTNLQALEAIAKQSASSESLAQTVNELTRLFSALARVLAEQAKHSSKSGGDWSRFENRLEDFKNILSLKIDNLSSLISHLVSDQRMLPKISAPKSLLILSLSVNGVLSLGMLLGFWGLWQGQEYQGERLQWLLQKATRQECITGIKSMNSQECQGTK